MEEEQYLKHYKAVEDWANEQAHIIESTACRYPNYSKDRNAWLRHNLIYSKLEQQIEELNEAMEFILDYLGATFYSQFSWAGPQEFPKPKTQFQKEALFIFQQSWG